MQTPMMLPPAPSPPSPRHRTVVFTAAMRADAATVLDGDDAAVIQAAAERLSAADRASTILPPSSRQ